MFLKFSVHFLPPILSNSSFLTYLLKTPGFFSFSSVVTQNWNLSARSLSLRKLWEKHHRLKQCLSWWNKHCFGNIFPSIKACESVFILLEEAMQASHTPSNLSAYNSKAAELELLLDKEEKYWRQKSSCKWNLDGDINTKLSHGPKEKTQGKNLQNH